MTHEKMIKFELTDDTILKLCGLAVLAEKLATKAGDDLDCVAAIDMAHDPGVRAVVTKLQDAGLVIR
jgi:hypothetical protein